MLGRREPTTIEQVYAGLAYSFTQLQDRVWEASVGEPPVVLQGQLYQNVGHGHPGRLSLQVR